MDDIHIVKWLIRIFLSATTCLEVFTDSMKPWSWVLKKIGEIMNHSLIEKVDILEKKLASHIKEQEEEDAIGWRTRILSFAGESRRGIQHTENEFNQILDDINRYEKFCADHAEFPNNKGEMSMIYIKAKYEECLKNNSFLQ